MSTDSEHRMSSVANPVASADCERESRGNLPGSADHGTGLSVRFAASAL
jgi:hypothetical protein